jgi:hypothetical protein
MLPEITQDDIDAVLAALPSWDPSDAEVQDIAERLLLRLHSDELLAAVALVRRMANLRALED